MRHRKDWKLTTDMLRTSWRGIEQENDMVRDVKHLENFSFDMISNVKNTHKNSTKNSYKLLSRFPVVYIFVPFVYHYLYGHTLISTYAYFLKPLENKVEMSCSFKTEYFKTLFANKNSLI